MANSEARIVELTESLESQILDKLQAEETIEELKEDIKTKESELKDLTNSLNKEKQIAEELTSEIDQYKQKLTSLSENNDKLKEKLEEKESFVQQSQNDAVQEIDSMKIKISDLEQEKENLNLDKKKMAEELAGSFLIFTLVIQLTFKLLSSFKKQRLEISIKRRD